MRHIFVFTEKGNNVFGLPSARFALGLREAVSTVGNPIPVEGIDGSKRLRVLNGADDHTTGKRQYFQSYVFLVTALLERSCCLQFLCRLGRLMANVAGSECAAISLSSSSHSK